MTQDRSAASELPNEAGTTAVVNGEPQVYLFDESGRSILVPESDVDYWVGVGFTRDKLDPATVRANIPMLAIETGNAWAAFIDGVMADGEIDASDDAAKATAERALSALLGNIARAQQIINARYGVKQPDGIVMLDPTGEEVFVDPGQWEEMRDLRGHTFPEGVTPPPTRAELEAAAPVADAEPGA